MTGENSGHPEVSIIVPFRDKVRLLRRCVRSVLERTDGVTYEMLLVDNRSVEPSTERFLDAVRDGCYGGGIRVLSYDKPFNYAAINNMAASEARGRLLLFLNDDVWTVDNAWLRRMCAVLERGDVGAAGAKLLYPDGTIQHAGIEIRDGDIAHAYAHQLNDGRADAGFNRTGDVLAVTAACMLTSRDVFLSIGGFDADNFAVAYNDVDYCLRLRKERDLKTVFVADAVLFHEESATRGRDIFKRFLHPERYRQFLAERQCLRERWRGLFGRCAANTSPLRRFYVRTLKKYIPNSVFAAYNAAKRFLRIPFSESRLAHRYLDGLRGIEIGGGIHNPFGLDTRNVDYTADVNRYKKLETCMAGKVLRVDIVASGDELPLSDASEDFVVSAHVLEHFPDPIRALQEWYRVIRPGGYIFMIVPHKDRTFDRHRSRTTLTELVDRHEGRIDPILPNEDDHYSVWITEDVVELIRYLGWETVDVRDIDDKVGNGFTVVIRKPL